MRVYIKVGHFKWIGGGAVFWPGMIIKWNYVLFYLQEKYCNGPFGSNIFTELCNSIRWRMVLRLNRKSWEWESRSAPLCVFYYTTQHTGLYIILYNIQHYNNTATECQRFVNEQTMMVNYRQLIFPSALHDIGHHC